MIWTRDRYLAHCRYEFTGREMFTELFGPLGALEDEWRAQGATEKEIGMTAFDWDYVLYTHLAGNCGAVTDREPVVIEDTPEHLIRVDAMGRTEKLIKKSATIPLPLDYPVKTMEDWLRVKPCTSSGRTGSIRKSSGNRGVFSTGDISRSSQCPAASTSRGSLWAKRGSAWPITTSLR